MQFSQRGGWPNAQRGSALNLLLPLLEQAAALAGRTVLGEVVVDQLDLRQFGHQRRHLGVLVRRDREGLVRRADLLRRRGQRLVVELLGIVEVARALDDAHRADLVAGPLARGARRHRKAGRLFRHRVVQESHAHRRLTAARTAFTGPAPDLVLAD